LKYALFNLQMIFAVAATDPAWLVGPNPIPSTIAKKFAGCSQEKHDQRSENNCGKDAEVSG
jgi:hypothetical protein